FFTLSLHDALPIFETFIDALFEIFRPTVGHPLAWARPGITALGRDDESFGIRVKRFFNEQFIGFGSVRVRRVDQVHTKLDGVLQDLARILAVWRPTPNALSCETHRSEPKSVDRQIATDAENGVVASISCYR